MLKCLCWNCLSAHVVILCVIALCCDPMCVTTPFALLVAMLLHARHHQGDLVHSQGIPQIPQSISQPSSGPSSDSNRIVIPGRR